jgi:threonine/homoserine/homoserine lactone efflux protein
MLLEMNLVLFLTASVALIVAPGPDNILVLTRGVAQGRGAALVSAAGASLGLVVHSVFAAAGLSALLAQSAVAFSVIKYVGAAYLVYLGVRALLGREGFAIRAGDAPSPRLRSILIQAFATNVLNPKVALFFLAFLPQFVVPHAGSAAQQLLLLGITFALLGLAFLCVLAYFSGALGYRVSTRPAYANVLRWLTGSVFIGLGLRLAFQDHR